MSADPNVALTSAAEYESRFRIPERIVSACWMDTQSAIQFRQNGENVALQTEPYTYGRSLVVRVAKLTVQESS